jgi:hypothetical protein
MKRLLLMTVMTFLGGLIEKIWLKNFGKIIFQFAPVDQFLLSVG